MITVDAQPVAAIVAKITPGVTAGCIKMTNGDQGRTYYVLETKRFQAHIDLSKSTCSELVALKAHNIRDKASSANALMTLLHEAEHIKLQSDDEGRVECAALESMRFWLGRLGYHGQTATQLVKLAWAEHAKLPAYFQTCTNREMEGT